MPNVGSIPRCAAPQLVPVGTAHELPARAERAEHGSAGNPTEARSTSTAGAAQRSASSSIRQRPIATRACGMSYRSAATADPYSFGSRTTTSGSHSAHAARSPGRLAVASSRACRAQPRQARRGVEPRVYLANDHSVLLVARQRRHPRPHVGELVLRRVVEQPELVAGAFDRARKPRRAGDQHLVATP